MTVEDWTVVLVGTCAVLALIVLDQWRTIGLWEGLAERLHRLAEDQYAVIIELAEENRALRRGSAEDE